MDMLILTTIVLLQILSVLSAIDGLYIHLWKLRLHRRPASYREHLWHTARALLFAPIVVTVFLAPTAGVVLWLGVGLLVADLAVTLADVLSERDSRAELGGLGRGEYALHVVLVTLHTAAVALALASRPAEAWSLAAPTTIGAYPAIVETLLTGVVASAVAVAGLHVWLAWKFRPATAACCAPAPA